MSDDIDFFAFKLGIGGMVVTLTSGVNGLARLKRDVARCRPFFSPFSPLLTFNTRASLAVGVLARDPGLLGPFEPNFCATPTGDVLAAVVVPDRLGVTTLAIASIVRDTGPNTCAMGWGITGALPTCGGLIFSETMFGVNVFLNTFKRCVFSARSWLKKFGET